MDKQSSKVSKDLLLDAFKGSNKLANIELIANNVNIANDTNNTYQQHFTPRRSLGSNKRDGSSLPLLNIKECELHRISKSLPVSSPRQINDSILTPRTPNGSIIISLYKMKLSKNKLNIDFSQSIATKNYELLDNQSFKYLNLEGKTIDKILCDFWAISNIENLDNEDEIFALSCYYLAEKYDNFDLYKKSATLFSNISRTISINNSLLWKCYTKANQHNKAKEFAKILGNYNIVNECKNLLQLYIKYGNYVTIHHKHLFEYTEFLKNSQDIDEEFLYIVAISKYYIGKVYVIKEQPRKEIKLICKKAIKEKCYDLAGYCYNMLAIGKSSVKYLIKARDNFLMDKNYAEAFKLKLNCSDQVLIKQFQDENLNKFKIINNLLNHINNQCNLSDDLKYQEWEKIILSKSTGSLQSISQKLNQLYMTNDNSLIELNMRDFILSIDNIIDS